MKQLSHLDKRRRWWEFQELYRKLSQPTHFKDYQLNDQPPNQTQHQPPNQTNSHNANVINNCINNYKNNLMYKTYFSDNLNTNLENSNLDIQKAHQILLRKTSNKAPQPFIATNHLTTCHLNSKNKKTNYKNFITLDRQHFADLKNHKRTTLTYSLLPKPHLTYSPTTTHTAKHSSSRQTQSKRQREWVYLSHYLAVEGLDPIHIISGNDDGREPDFTLIFYKNRSLVYIGIELTTLPRLRDRMGENHLIGKRWYWQGLLTVARLRTKMLQEQCYRKSGCYPNYDRFRLPVKTLYMPTTQFKQRHSQLPLSPITQQDVDAVMSKKAHKADGYHARRPLDELWLLVHTDKYQPDCILTADKSGQALTHNSGYDQIHITRYPSHKVLKVINEYKANF